MNSSKVGGWMFRDNRLLAKKVDYDHYFDKISQLMLPIGLISCQW